MDYIERFDEQDRVEDGLTEARFRFWNAPLSEVNKNRSRYKILLSSTKHYLVTDPADGLNPKELKAEVKNVIKFAQQGRYYAVAQVQPARSQECKYYINLLDDTLNAEDPIARRIEYPTSLSEVEEIIRDIIYLMQGRHTEGMHLVEHVILRPKGEAVVPLNTIHFTAEGKTLDPFVTDPYSFQVSIFLPGWTPRFANREFRGIVERTIRSETPAHILPWIYWVNPVKIEKGNPVPPAEFVNFEVKFKSWLEHANEYLTITTSKSVQARNEFVEAFNALIDLRKPIPGNGEVTIVELTNTYQPYDIER